VSSGCGLGAVSPSPFDVPQCWGSRRYVCVTAESWRLCARAEPATLLGSLVVSSGARTPGGEGETASSKQGERGGQRGVVSEVTKYLKLLGWETTGSDGL
jgi:hypothetical protein